jgi:hypothetical protein
MVVMGAGLLAMVALHFTLARRSASPVPAQSKPVPSPATNGPTPQLARELDELGKRLADELDTRADRLEKLIADADDRLSRLERLTAASVYLAPESTSALTEVKHFGPRDPAQPTHAPMAPSAIPTHRSAAAVIAEIDPLANEVYKLADTGMLPVQIAQKLSQHTGKIELLLALRRG